MRLSRRQLLAAASACAAFPRAGLAQSPREVSWEELVPEGTPYSEIIGEGYLDEENDIWLPIFDEHATKMNPELDDAYIIMPGFILPLEMSVAGITTFVLVPFVGACIHVPPPPANQLVFVTTDTPWPADDIWGAVWVTGQMSHGVQTTEVAETGYVLVAEKIEEYLW